MKHVLTGLALITALSIGAAPAVAADAREDTLRAVDRSWGTAYAACDVAAWDALLGKDVVFIHNNGMIDDKAKQMASVKGCGIETLLSAVNSVRFYGDETAVVLGNMQGKVKGRDFRFDLLYTRVYIRQAGTWRLVSHQSTDAPKKAN